MSGGWIQYLIVIMLFGSGFLNWVLQKAKEQRQLKKVQEERERSRRELLRTGRPADDAGDELAPPGDLAAGRQAQLHELRRQQEQRLRELREKAQRRQQQVRQPGAQPPATPSRVLPTAPPRAPAAPAQPRRVAVPPRVPAQPVASAPVAARRRRPPPSVSGGIPLGHTIESSRDDEHPTHRIVSDVKKVSRPAVHPLAPQTARDWRAAIIAAEILGRPVSEREPEA